MFSHINGIWGVVGALLTMAFVVDLAQHQGQVTPLIAGIGSTVGSTTKSLASL